MKKIDVKELNELIEVKAEDEIITNYYFGNKYARPFLYPIIGPYGKGVTRNFPMKNVEGETNDHLHHKSVWTAYGDVNGVDDWSEEQGHGKIIHKKFIELTGGEFCHIVTLNDWVSNDNKKVLEEERDIKIYNLDSDEKIFDFEINFKATDDDVKFGDTKEGGIISVRVATSMDGDKGGMIENSEGGRGEKECWGKRAKWCDYYGKVDNKVVGIAIFDHPNNFRYPTYWHVRDYGLFTANPFGISHFENNPEKKGDFILEKNKGLRFKYRIFIHRGDAKETNLEEKHKAYLNLKIE